MEVFTGDRCMPTGVVLYPDNLTHFPTTPSQDHSPGLFTQPPPQKLRPIRCNGRNPVVDFADPTTGALEGSLISCYGPPLDELGFFTPPSTEKQSEGKEGGECSSSRGHLGSCALPENLGVILENTCSLVGVELLAQAHKFDELSSSLDAGEETPEAIEKPSNRKRKRRSRAKLKSFVESMIIGVMQKQEQLHGQMLEILEKKEKERLEREEAWKQQEIERAKREREERAQETSRSLALISFIQKLMGQEIQFPAPLEILSQDKEEDEIPNQEDISNNQEKRNDLKYCLINKQEKLEVAKYVPGNNEEYLDRDPNNKRWPKSEVQALITVRTALTQKLNSKGIKNSLWEEVAMEMSNLGYNRTSKKCREKWDNINKYYRRLVENGSTKRSDKSKVCQYFNELDILYKSGSIGSGTPDSFKKDIEEEQSVVEGKRAVEE